MRSNVTQSGKCARAAKFRLLLVCSLAIGATAQAKEATSPAQTSAAVASPDLTAFLTKYCVDCHGAEEPKAGLRLDGLKLDLTSADNFRGWTKILDRIESGEMPPKVAERPAPADQAKFVALLTAKLLAADAQSLPQPGSLVLRRMTRQQYENSVCDLLSIKLDLQSRLPADGRALGFDNVGAALSLSSAQLEIYLDAADAALDAAIIKKPRSPGIKQRLNGLETMQELTARVNGRMWNQEDVAITYGRMQFYVGRDAAPEDGRYRVRMSLYSVQNGGEPAEIYVASPHKNGDKVIGYYNVPADVPQVLDIDCWLLKGARVQVSTPKFGYVNKRSRTPQVITNPGIAVEWVEIDGPLYDQWPPQSHQRLFGELPLELVSSYYNLWTVKSTEPLADAERLLGSFMRRAYRRPVTSEEIAKIVALVAAQLDQKQSFEESMRVGYKAVLCSPDFLFFQDRPGENDELALASRLSYFLWNTMPDEELLTLAEKQELSKPEVLRAQTERLLKDPKAQRFIQNFLGQWLDLRLIDFTTPDPKIYPEFNGALQEAMVAETKLFFEDVLNENRSLLNFIDSDYTFLNERLATHYGIKDVKGTEMRRVSLPADSHRGGVMTMASVLKVTANGSYTHPVHRGVWLLRNIVGQPPDPPPPNAGAIEPDLRGAKTIHEQLAVHRQSQSCAGCHSKIDPLGFALENFDVMGTWQEKYRILSGPMLSLNRNGPAVEANYELSDGRAFQNVDELKKLLLTDKDQLARCLTEKLLVYSSGRALRFSDRQEVNGVIERIRKQGYGLRSLVHEIVQSRVFQSK